MSEPELPLPGFMVALCALAGVGAVQAVLAGRFKKGRRSADVLSRAAALCALPLWADDASYGYRDLHLERVLSHAPTGFRSVHKYSLPGVPSNAPRPWVADELAPIVVAYLDAVGMPEREYGDSNSKLELLLRFSSLCSPDWGERVLDAIERELDRLDAEADLAASGLAIPRRRRRRAP